ncbi:MAG: hypothetical protein DRO87_12235, partial [Candidatus Thorarchaeota archaeon]
SLKDAVDKIDQLGKILEKAVSSKSAKADDIKAFGNLLNELKDAIGKFSGSSRTIDNPNLSKEALKTIEELRKQGKKVTVAGEKIAIEKDNKEVINAIGNLVDVVTKLQANIGRKPPILSQIPEGAGGAPFSAKELSTVAKEFVNAYNQVIKKASESPDQRGSARLLEAAFKAGNFDKIIQNAADIPNSDALREITNLAKGMSEVSNVLKEITKVAQDFGKGGAVGGGAGGTGGTGGTGGGGRGGRGGRDEEEDPNERNRRRRDVKTKTVVENLVKSQVSKERIAAYKETLIEPDMDIDKALGAKLKSRNKNVRQASQEIRDNVAELANSLKELQGDIIQTLEQGLPDKGGKMWKIVRKEGAPIKDYFKAAGTVGDINRKKSRYWKLEIANVGKLKELLHKDYMDKTPVVDLVKEAKDYYRKKISRKLDSPEKKAAAIAEWVHTTSQRGVEEWGDTREPYVKSRNTRLLQIKKKYKGLAVSQDMVKDIQDTFANELQQVFEDTYAKVMANRKIFDKGYVRTLHVPALRMSKVGTPVLETSTGSQRAVAGFATLKTGVERIFESLTKHGLASDKYKQDVIDVGIRPSSSADIRKADKLVRDMLLDLVNAGKMDAGKLKYRYKEAAIMKGAELKRAGAIEDIPAFVDKITSAFDKLSSGSVNNLIDRINELGVSAYDVAKALDKVEFQNVYDVYKKILNPPLTELAKNPDESRIRNFEKAVRQVEQLMPLAPPSKARRAYHQQNVVNFRTRLSSAFQGLDYEQERQLTSPDAQKELIRQVNLRLNDMINEAKVLKKSGLKRTGALPKQIENLSSLGLPESQASTIVDFRKGRSLGEDDETYGKGVKYLKPLGGMGIKLYKENLPLSAPFGQFQQIGRNIASVTNAITSNTDAIKELPGAPIQGVTTEFPSLRTEKEKALISAGRYGTSGYGFNVVTELRHTASTFEDQIVVSGKLAKALTMIVRNIVAPSPKGRSFTDKDIEKVGLPIAAAVSELQNKVLADLPMEKRVEEVSRTLQKVLGVKDTYKGRADKALISDIEEALSVVRGADVNVQTAKLTEVFLSHFG